jgi:hypothetical protein
LKHFFATLLLSLCLCPVAKNQTVFPLTAEYGKGKAAGSFAVRNDGLQPIFVTVEPQSFTLDKNGQHVSKLSPDVHVTLSETSFRIPPRSTEVVNYKIKTDSTPQMLLLAAGMTIGHTSEGIAVRVWLPTALYICDKAKDCRKNSLDRAGLLVQK